MSVDRGFPVVLRLPVLWGDADALGHVNNVRYFRWMESARIEYFRRLGLDATGSGTGPVLATTTCDYLRPVHFPGDVDVGVRVAKIGGSSVAMEYGISLSSGELVARGSSVVVIVSYATMTKVTVPDDVRAAIARLEGWLGAVIARRERSRPFVAGRGALGPRRAHECRANGAPACVFAGDRR